MYPNLFGIEFIHTYGFLIAVGLIAAMALFWFLARKFSLSAAAYDFYSTVVIIAAGVGFGGAYGFQAIYGLIDYFFFKKPLVLGGMTFYGGLITGAAAFILITKFFAKPSVKNEFFDAVNLAAPCIVLAHAFGRFGCFAAGCCYGLPSEEFGVKFPFLRSRVLPTQLYEAFFLLFLFAAMMLLLFVFRKKNIQLILYGTAYSVFRFFIEYLRDDNRGKLLPLLTPSQWQSIFLLLVIGALALLIYKYKKIPFKQKEPIIKEEAQKTEEPPKQEEIQKGVFQ